MFYECIKITEINLSNFNTSNVTSMLNIFTGCSSLISLNLSNFNTSKVKNMEGMFESCSSLTSLDLSNFNTSQVTDMDGMFNSCSSLTTLDLSNFDTSLVMEMYYMFYNCSLLTSLNLSNFNTSQVIYMDSMFYSCINLEYINLGNFEESNLELYDNIFFSIPENSVICINENITKQKNFPQIIPIACHVIDCSNNWKSKQKKIIKNNNECIESCDKSLQYKYEYSGKCVENCVNGLLYDDNNNALNICKCEFDKCLIYPPIALNKNLCTKCNVNYYPKENDPLNIGEYINCYNKPEGYYLDKNLYKMCYNTCKACNIKGNDLIHNCIKCNENFLFGIKINNYFNCYENCSYYHYFDKNENTFYCK